MWIVVVEWDGDKPPTKFYNRTKALKLRVRGGSKSESPLARRQIDDGSVIMQEGAFIVASESMARQIAGWAHQFGAKAVKVGMVDAPDYFMTEQDIRVMHKIENVLGRRGRPTEEPQDWAITCLEEMATFELLQVRDAICCPHCSGLNFLARVGTIDSFSIPDGDYFQAWLRHRFSRGRFEHPYHTPGSPLPPPLHEIVFANSKELQSVDNMRKSTGLQTALAKMPRDVAMEVMDSVFGSITYGDRDASMSARLYACMRLVKDGVDATQYSLASNPDNLDVMDGAKLLTADTAARLYNQYHLH